LPDFSWHKIPRLEKYTKKTTKYTKWPQPLPTPLIQDTPTFTQIGILSLKIYHLATLSAGTVRSLFDCRKIFFFIFFFGFLVLDKIAKTAALKKFVPGLPDGIISKPKIPI
jgi:hypothetical protein